MYFVQEYLQPVKSDHPETTVTIVASHGNLLTSFDYIIHYFVHQEHAFDSFGRFNFPVSTGLTHGEILLYLITGSELIQRIASFQQKEIPITINHAQLARDYHYQWASILKCKVSYFSENYRVLFVGYLDFLGPACAGKCQRLYTTGNIKKCL